MAFTDDDLKRLKEEMENAQHIMEGHPTFCAKMMLPKWEALLARLKAAEKVIWKSLELDDSISLGNSDLETHNRIVDEARQAMDEWRKSAGR